MGHFPGEERVEMCPDRLPGLDGKARCERIEGGIGQHLGGIEVQFASPDQSRLLTLLDNSLEEPAEVVQTVADTDAGELE